MLTDFEKAYFDKHKIPYPTRDLDPAKVAAARKIWARQLKKASPEELLAHAKGHVAWTERDTAPVGQKPPSVEDWQKAAADDPAPSQAEPQTVNVRVDAPVISLPKAELRTIIVLLAWIIILLSLSIRAHGQVDVIKVQDNAGNPVGTIAAPFTFKAGANCSWSKSQATYTFNCAGGAAAAGGLDTQLQRNATGSLAGISTFTSDGTINTAQVGANFLHVDPADTSKKFRFIASNITTATTRDMNVPDANATFAQAISAVGHKFITAMSGQGLFTLAQPDYLDLTGVPSTFAPLAHNLFSAQHGDTVAHTPVLGDLPFANSTPAWDTLAGNITATKKYLCQTGNGSISAAPAWCQGAFADLSGSISVAQSQSLAGDVTGAVNATVVGKVNGVTYGASPATDTIPVITAANTATYKAVPDCTDTGGNHLNYTASTHAISCGTSGGGATAPTFITLNDRQGANFTPTANKVTLWAFPLPNGVATGHVAFYWPTADGTGFYDLGLYDSGGTLKLNVGAFHPTTGVPTNFAWAQGSTTLAAGLYYLGVTGNAAVAAIRGCGNCQAFTIMAATQSVTSSSGGALPASITIPSTAIADGVNPPAIVLYP